MSPWYVSRPPGVSTNPEAPTIRSSSATSSALNPMAASSLPRRAANEAADSISRQERDGGSAVRGDQQLRPTAFERRLCRRNPTLGGGREERAAWRATTVGRGAKPPSASALAPPRAGSPGTPRRQQLAG